MGYTHYFGHEKVSDKTWNAMANDFKKLFEALPTGLQLSGTDMAVAVGEFPDICDKDGLFCNGVGEKGHETFVIHRGGATHSNGFEFCKTAYKPYDLYVCACLIAYCYHSRETMDLGSDGDREDWADAIAFAGEVLGPEYITKFRLEGGAAWA